MKKTPAVMAAAVPTILRAVVDSQGVLQHRADGKAHAESEDHQQGYADVAVTVFLDQEGHAVEEAEEGSQGNPR